MSRSEFIRTMSTGSFPSLRSPRHGRIPRRSPRPSSAPDECRDLRIESKAEDGEQFDPSAFIASRAACFTHAAMTVPYCGPTEMPMRDGLSSPPSGLLPDRLDVLARISLKRLELELLRLPPVLDTGLRQVIEIDCSKFGASVPWRPLSPKAARGSLPKDKRAVRAQRLNSERSSDTRP